jgi:hypothetical protein
VLNQYQRSLGPVTQTTTGCIGISIPATSSRDLYVPISVLLLHYTGTIQFIYSCGLLHNAPSVVYHHTTEVSNSFMLLHLTLILITTSLVSIGSYSIANIVVYHHMTESRFYSIGCPALNHNAPLLCVTSSSS